MHDEPEESNYGPIGDDEFVDQVIDAMCRRRVNLQVVDEQSVATVVSMTFAHLRAKSYRLVRATG